MTKSQSEFLSHPLMIRNLFHLFFFTLYMGAKRPGGTNHPENSAVFAIVLIASFFLLALMGNVFFYIGKISQYIFIPLMIIIYFYLYRLIDNYFVKSGRWIGIIAYCKKLQYLKRLAMTFLTLGIVLCVVLFNLSTLELLFK